ncbi:MAG: hypothetical protein KAS32_04350 [Candidatus Peribacteraceae bacterium]|nr:hypothetical protein [Candidatus Peribacteraceae bacterium]
MSSTLVQNWPIIIFLLFQVVGSWKILANIKSAGSETTTGLEVIKVQLLALEAQVIKQNSRVGKLEDKYEDLSVNVAAHVGGNSNSK